METANNYTRGFANEINLVSERTRNLSANECERFGMTWGCRTDCPVFERGECQIQEENELFFNSQPL